MPRSALISGIAGQDGAFLARLLLERGYTVYGGVRSGAANGMWRLEALGIRDEVKLLPFDLTDDAALRQALGEIRPDETYNLAAQSSVSTSFEQPLYTTRANALAVTELLETIRLRHPEMRFYQASSSDIFGKPLESPQSEKTGFRPQSPYAIAKAYAHWMTANYRDAYGLFACSGILFNHESTLRSLTFVSRKISSTLAHIKCSGVGEPVLALGNLEASRDWGFAGDYVLGIWQMMQRARPDDFVLATGCSHSVRQFVEGAARALDFEVEWTGAGVDEVGRDRKSGRILVKVDPRLFRPVDLSVLTGDWSKARRELGWGPRVAFEELVSMMVEADYNRLRSGETLQ
jgi:GDPmannose 4,6-dehydratase